jgi:hypothetical protein
MDDKKVEVEMEMAFSKPFLVNHLLLLPKPELPLSKSLSTFFLEILFFYSLTFNREMT